MASKPDDLSAVDNLPSHLASPIPYVIGDFAQIENLANPGPRFPDMILFVKIFGCH